MSNDFDFYDLELKQGSEEIGIIFPNWKAEDEVVVIFSSHDYDVILGIVYAVLAALKNLAEVHVVIFCDGSAGYSRPELKEDIVEIRREETFNALKILGLNKEVIHRLDMPDFSAFHHLGWKLPWQEKSEEDREGLFSKILSLLREIKVNRFMIPNGYWEHIDHAATYLSAMFDGPQVGDPVLIDRGAPTEIKTYLQYSVWAKFSPEDALMKGRNSSIRANKAITASKSVEEKIEESLQQFKSQGEIIANLLESREERRLEGTDKYVELYRELDPRPRFDYDPYKELISKINGG
mgnify:CR=1 FL=1